MLFHRLTEAGCDEEKNIEIRMKSQSKFEDVALYDERT